MAPMRLPVRVPIYRHEIDCGLAVVSQSAKSARCVALAWLADAPPLQQRSIDGLPYRSSTEQRGLAEPPWAPGGTRPLHPSTTPQLSPGKPLPDRRVRRRVRAPPRARSPTQPVRKERAARVTQRCGAPVCPGVTPPSRQSRAFCAAHARARWRPEPHGHGMCGGTGPCL